jgi:hypothetical protein
MLWTMHAPLIIDIDCMLFCTLALCRSWHSWLSCVSASNAYPLQRTSVEGVALCAWADLGANLSEFLSAPNLFRESGQL